MAVKYLEPRMELLREEYVLIQAWKKTAAYIRYHNSFADTLTLDRAAVNLPEFLGKLRDRLTASNRWKNDPLRLVLAPKSQNWHVDRTKWGPVDDKAPVRLRPLGHVSLEDQVIATAIMLCLADRIETRQGDPREEIDNQESRIKVVSYGNRLFCDRISGILRHRWGSGMLYRAYFQDYRTFLSRPKTTLKTVPQVEDKDIYVMDTDLAKFYDRVRPKLLVEATKRIQHGHDDPEFFSFLGSVFNWKWDSRDEEVAQKYAKESEIDDFTQVALPQGLVASGFFANLVLLSFDDELRAKIGTEISGEILLLDVCRYVDDLRLVIAADQDKYDSPDDLKNELVNWLQQTLTTTAPGLKLSDEEKKTKVIELGHTPHMFGQSQKMKRIQTAISGGFDAQGGEEILDAILGMLRSQKELKLGDNDDLFLVPDVREVTVDRFSARRYRNTFRSTRPLLPEEDKAVPPTSLSAFRSRTELDQEAKRFAFDLIQRWINDPSNVLLMRIGLDLWPDVEVLKYILSLLRPLTQNNSKPVEQRQIAWYCLSEIFRVGATETGIVSDKESLPSGVCLKSYRKVLHEEAVYLVKLPDRIIPWYLRQQALLFLATYDPGEMSGKPQPENAAEFFGDHADVVTDLEPASEEIQKYWELIRFLRDDQPDLSDSEFATCAVIARRAFLSNKVTLAPVRNGLSRIRIKEIAKRDPSFFLELLDTGNNSEITDHMPKRIRQDLCLNSRNSEGDTLAHEILNQPPLKSQFRNELSLLHFAVAFLEKWNQPESIPRVITPEQITLKLEKNADNRINEVEVHDLNIIPEIKDDVSDSIYCPPCWCSDEDRWRIQLGFLLRFILSRHPDFTRHAYRTRQAESESAYRPIRSHRYLRLYGLYNGQPAFGDDWLPITDWFEKFLLALLAWPGCCTPEEFGWVKQGINSTRTKIKERIEDLKERHGAASRTLILPLNTRLLSNDNEKHLLRACIVQTVFPSDDNFQRDDLTLNNPKNRQIHRNHLSVALAAVKRMLVLRNTHENSQEKLDWLILPELAVHRDDVYTHLIPFARFHKSIILAGLTFQEIFNGEPLVNSALWIIPEQSDSHGLQIRTRRQGKCNLTKKEQAFNDYEMLVQGFRPCQWLIEYPWSNNPNDDPLWLTASVCYDATDLTLVADLKNQSDILAIPALNKDVGTFDKMAMALHYHMFQYVIVANNGSYGGSNAYFPHKNPHIRKVFHTHGQPQATISFLDVVNIPTFQKRKDILTNVATDNEKQSLNNDYKFPPADSSRKCP
ncbi:MAG: RNA-directed DNA polymerase [Bacteroidota bacterium]|nr:RNA-directed DNA polymerase [Bacteroidota bacterium]MYE62685.1 hypothetical protein [Rhodothermaceae bacterium]MYJ19805.1 hypothetical protein [Rhodothermaceae bacterium]